MRAPISVIIPTLNAEAGLSRCLYSLMEGLDAGLIRELIVSDGGSSDATGAIAQAWGAKVLQGPASRGAQLRSGCARAQGRWLLVLHADTALAQGWAGAMRSHMEASHEAGWCRLRFDRRGPAAWFVARWANLRSHLGLPYGDQGMLLPRALYDQVGGYPDIPLMEDVALARALRGKMRRLDAVAVTSAEKYLRQGWLRRGSRNLLTLIRYQAGWDPKLLASRYRR